MPLHSKGWIKIHNQQIRIFLNTNPRRTGQIHKHHSRDWMRGKGIISNRFMIYRDNFSNKENLCWIVFEMPRKNTNFIRKWRKERWRSSRLNFWKWIQNTIKPREPMKFHFLPFVTRKLAMAHGFFLHNRLI
jgi:hypothetical protein